MPPSRYIRLTEEEEDAKLREIEQAPYSKPKVRLRAQVLRLSHRATNMRTISAYTGRSRASVGRDLDRFRERGFEGLFDGTAPGNPPRISAQMRTFMEGKLSEERTWTPPSSPRLLGRVSGWGSRPRPCASTWLDGLLVETHALRTQQSAGPRTGS